MDSHLLGAVLLPVNTGPASRRLEAGLVTEDTGFYCGCPEQPPQPTRGLAKPPVRPPEWTLTRTE